MASNLSIIQLQILQFARDTSFHGTLGEFCDRFEYSKEDVESAATDLKRKRIITGSSNLWNSWISVTNYGWSVMGWS